MNYLDIETLKAIAHACDTTYQDLVGIQLDADKITVTTRETGTEKVSQISVGDPSEIEESLRNALNR